MDWTEDRVVQLKDLWAQGLSGSQIAAKLGGVTRNEVLRKAHFLKLTGRAAVSSTSGHTRRAPSPEGRHL